MGENGLSASDVAVLSGNYGRSNNDGMFGGDWGAWIILFLIFGLFGNGRGFGGFGGSCGSPCATQADVRAAVDQQTLISKIDQQTYGLADSFTALNNTLNSNFRGIDNAICTLGYQNQQGFNNLGHQISDCCCTTQRLVEKGFCDLGNAMNLNTRDILESNNANTRAILDFLTQDKIATLTAENQNLKLAASQSNQNAVLMAAMDAKQSYRSNQSMDGKQKLMESLEDYMDDFTEKIKEISRDSDFPEERELINKFMSKLQNIR